MTESDIPWSVALPTIPAADLKRLSVGGVPLDLHGVQATVDRVGLQAVSVVLVAADVLPWDRPVVTVVPALWMVADDRIESSSTRLTNVLGRLHYERWREVMFLRPEDFLMADGVGVGTANELMRVALEAGLGALCRGSSERDENRETSIVPFLDQLPQRLRSSIERLEPDRSPAKWARTVGEVLVAAPDDVRRSPLRGLLPGLERLEGEIPLSRLSGSVVSALAARGWTSLAHTAKASVHDVLAMPSVGQGKAAELFAVVAEEWLAASLHAGQEGWENQALRTLRILSAWAFGERQAEQVGSVLGLALPDDAPSEVVEAAEQLRSMSLSSLAGRLADRYSVRERVVALCEELDERDLHILRSRVLSIGRPPTLEDVGAGLGLTRERVRQLQQGLVTRLRARVDEADMGPLLRRARRLRAEIGVAVPMSSPQLASLETQAAPGDADLADLIRRLLLWVAGPYGEDAGWLIATGAPPDLDGLPGRLRAHASDGLIGWEAVREEAASAGLRPDVVEAWLDRIGGFRTEPDGLLPWHGSVTDKCEVLLLRLGEPTTVEALVDLVDEGYSVRSVRNRLFEDPRFIRTSKTEIGLRAWGVDEYTSVVVEMAEEIERRGGKADLADLSITLADRYGVSRSSVQIYATTAPMFRTVGGIVRMLGPEEPVTVEGTVESTAGCYLIDGCWSLRVDVDADLLRGSGRSIPPAFSGHVGVLPGGRKELTTAYGAVLVTWPLSSPMGPSIGSLREEAASLRAERGDYLFVRYLGEAGFDCRILRREIVESSSWIDRLCLMVGHARLGRPESEVARAVAASLGVPAGAADESSWQAVRTALLRRGEQRLAELLGRSPVRSEEEALERLWNALQ